MEPERQYDVALSFAGEDRAYVAEVASRLRDAGVRLFYDEYAVVETWGRNLMDVFEDVYRERSRYAVVFVSVHYLAKPWPRHERRSAEARALLVDDPYLLPVQLDDSQLPGLPPTVGHIDGRRYTPEDIARLVVEKLGGPVTESPSSSLAGVPRTEEDVAALLATRPPAWEYLLYAGLLVQGMQSLDSKWRDHRMKLARPGGQVLSDEEALQALRTLTNGPLTAIRNFDRVMSPEAAQDAFGAPGEPGDPDAIHHLARSFLAVYEYLLDWAMDTRSLGVGERFATLRDISAEMTGEAIVQIRDFIDHFAARMEQVPEQLQRDEPVEIILKLTITVNDDVIAAHAAEARRLGSG